MRRLKNNAVSLALMMVMAGASWVAAEPPAPKTQVGEDLAAVPQTIVSALQKVNQGSKKRRAARVETSEGGVVKVESGRNVNLTVAGDQLNRIMTPFANPVVHTVSKAKINVDGPVIYVSLAQDDGPATMFVTENGESDPSISLTLAPKDVPPREIRLTLAGTGPVTTISASAKSAKWEKSQPYTEALEKVMLATARGEVPPGYNLRHPVAHDPAPRCRLPVRLEPRQVLEGHNFLVVVSRLTNTSSQQLLMDESACYQEGVRAVAVWPRVSLNPRQSTELYLVYHREMGQKPSRRPSVLYQGIPGPDKPRQGKPRRRPEPDGAALSRLLDDNRPVSAHLP